MKHDKDDEINNLVEAILKGTDPRRIAFNRKVLLHCVRVRLFEWKQDRRSSLYLPVFFDEHDK